MSRSGYDDDGGEYPAGLWYGAVASAIRGRRGQAFLRETLAALDALESRRLISGELVSEGEVCVLGAVGTRRGLDLTEVDPVDHDVVAETFGIAGALAREMMEENDRLGPRVETPDMRYARMRKWVEGLIVNRPPDNVVIE